MAFLIDLGMVLFDSVLQPLRSMIYIPTVTVAKKLVNYIILLKGRKFIFLVCGSQIFRTRKMYFLLGQWAGIMGKRECCSGFGEQVCQFISGKSSMTGMTHWKLRAT